MQVKKFLIEGAFLYSLHDLLMEAKLHLIMPFCDVTQFVSPL
jgi:hypothetical protein